MVQNISIAKPQKYDECTECGHFLTEHYQSYGNGYLKGCGVKYLSKHEYVDGVWTETEGPHACLCKGFGIIFSPNIIFPVPWEEPV